VRLREGRDRAPPGPWAFSSVVGYHPKVTAEKKLAIDMTAGPTEKEVDSREESQQHDGNNKVWQLGTIAIHPIHIHT
jgi:hypothetical protein